MGRMRRRGAVSALAALALVLAGCAAMPTSGPVREGSRPLSDPAPVFPQGYGPVPDAEPEEIVRGFLAAGAGSAGQSGAYATAREYLTADANGAWDPSASVLVYAAEATPVVDEEAAVPTPGTALVRYTFPVAATVDSEGRFSEAAPGERSDAVFELTQDAARQWRIQSLPDGLLLSRPNFDLLYRATSLYFLSADRTHLVPEVRWFSRVGTATSAVKALVTSGPSPWLRDGVVSAVPEGTLLAQDLFDTAGSGSVRVSLDGPVDSLTPTERGLLLAQLDATLAPLLRTRGVTIEANGVPLTGTPAPGLIRDPIPQGGLVALTESGIGTVVDRVVSPIEGVLPPAGLTAIAQGRDGAPLVGLVGKKSLVDLRSDDGTALVTGKDLLQPSVDRLGWVWTGERTNAGLLLVSSVGGSQLEVPVQWLEGAQVRSIRVARDASRIAIVSAVDGAVTVDVAAVVRDASGAPQRLSGPVRVGTVLLDAGEVAWLDESTLAVLGTSGTLVTAGLHLVPLAGLTTALAPLPGGASPVALAVGKGDRSLFVVATDGRLFSRQTAGWVEVASRVRDVAFPG